MSLPKSNDIQTYEGRPAILRASPLPIGTPKKPTKLGLNGEKLWDKLVPELVSLGIAKSIDETALEGLCRWWQAYKVSADALATIQDFSSIDATRCLNSCRATWTEFSKIARQFGLTASSRNGINVGATESEIDDYLGG